ncbi:FAD-binding oxidoreductase [Serratia marcescens]|uniref:FAD-binding oxidoreductase n=1 Tax=Serratia marcescens TaxID=615 RepID=A0A939STG4_SERMA|nr:FAD-binding oxidoreductase [Serratia marcescens]
MESHRLTAHGTMVLTVKLGYAYGSKTPNIPDQGAYVALEQVLRARYPALHDLGIKHCWSGYVSGAYDFLPVLGAMGEKQIFSIPPVARAMDSHQSFIGLLLAKQINGRTPELLAALHHKTPSMLPEPLQWWHTVRVCGG